MEASVHVIQQHREEDEGSSLSDCIFPSSCPAPHHTEDGEEKPRQTHRWLGNEHRQITGCYGYRKSLDRRNPALDLPEYQQIDGKMKAIDVEEAVQ